MLIVSDFHDYYDSITSFGIDKTVVYQRKQRARELNTSRYHNGRSQDPSLLLPTGRSYSRALNGRHGGFFRLIGFCGKFYPFIDIVIPGYAARCFTSDGTIEAMNEHGFGKLDKRAWRNDSLSSVEGIKRAFDLERYKPFERFFLEEKCPIFIAGDHDVIPVDLRDANYSSYRHYILFNPCLKDWSFASIKDPVTAFQEIFMYISGVLGTPENPTVEIDDKHKAIAKGHDGRYSFRKPPGGGRWR